MSKVGEKIKELRLESGATQLQLVNMPAVRGR